jgi:UDP-3-O-[3-hydroxymyristoyl] glucosamine N-acyltransferase
MIHIAHNVQIGEDTAMAAFAGVAGSTKIGKRCTIGGQAGIDGHLEIADDVHIAGTSLITKSIARPGVYSSAIKAGPAGEWRKTVARLRTLDDMARRIKDLEQKVKRLLTEKTR